MKADRQNVVFLARVIKVQDEHYGFRIKAKIDKYDDRDEEDIPWAFPLLPKMVHVMPKLEETVLIILQEQGAVDGCRFYIGPLISQPYFMNDSIGFQSTTLLNNGFPNQALPNPIMDTDNDGTLPNLHEIAIEGRHNADVILGDNEVKIRCGFKRDVEPSSDVNSLIYNNKTIAYIQMKYGDLLDANKVNYNSVINIVADRINLMSHDANQNLGEPINLISDDEQGKISSGVNSSGSHPVVYGDSLIKWIQEFIKIFRTHTHPFAMDPPLIYGYPETFLGKDLNTMVSKTIHVS